VSVRRLTDSTLEESWDVEHHLGKAAMFIIRVSIKDIHRPWRSFHVHHLGKSSEISMSMSIVLATLNFPSSRRSINLRHFGQSKNLKNPEIFKFSY